MAKAKHSSDILVIGGGPAGLHAAFYAAWRGLNVVLLEAQNELGGQMAALYPDKRVYDVPGHPAARASHIVRGLIQQLDEVNQDGSAVHIQLNTLATGLEQTQDGWLVHSSDQSFQASAVILALGMGALLPRQVKLPLATQTPKQSQIQKPQIHFTLPDPSDLAGQNVVIVGGVPQAVHAALELAEVGAQVTLTHRRAGFRGTPEQLEQLTQLQDEKRLEIIAPAQLRSVSESVELEAAGKIHHISAQHLVVFNGVLPSLDDALTWPLNWQGEYIPDGLGGATCLPGVFAVGDVAQSSAEFKLISVALAGAAMTANHAVHFVRPDLKVKPGHSSEKSYGR